MPTLRKALIDESEKIMNRLINESDLDKNPDYKIKIVDCDFDEELEKDTMSTLITHSLREHGAISDLEKVQIYRIIGEFDG